MLNIEEIKAREQAATPGPWIVGDGTKQSFFNGKNAVISQDGRYVVADRAVYPDVPDFNEQVFFNMAFIAHSRTDIPALIAEVERLTEENAETKARLDRFVEAGFKVGEENATLKKALELMCEQFKDEGNCILEGCTGLTCIQDCAKCMHDYFIHQAQEQLTHESTHETHGESEAHK